MITASTMHKHCIMHSCMKLDIKFTDLTMADYTDCDLIVFARHNKLTQQINVES